MPKRRLLEECFHSILVVILSLSCPFRHSYSRAFLIGVMGRFLYRDGLKRQHYFSIFHVSLLEICTTLSDLLSVTIELLCLHIYPKTLIPA